ncbi:PKD domain-containing protein [Chryseobacterium sp. SL1]|uniref:PKD domain-containing protein n=1 Tax=Chryseobacterium sp. SL1 TaxID=2995159 RepID=UPI002273B205|nr:PKD domain-containing protein [Chryseobacterium sp. SL1]MCY1662538.1 PKD domain-containing protein [Chryseobacterium sp. SL1]
MNAKLDNVTTQYRKFNENQVLTDGQLNEFIDYFEDQDRLSRTLLSGVGIVCGFKSTITSSGLITEVMEKIAPRKAENALDTIVITQGAGVTTDGDLITLRTGKEKSSDVTIDFDTKNFRYFREYKDKVRYDHFRIGEDQIPLLELATEDELKQMEVKGLDTGSFKDIKTLEKLNEKIIILYLESYSNDETPCEDADCDNTGAEQVSDLKVLLADFQSVSDLMTSGNAKDTLYKIHNSYEELFDRLPNIEAKRVILDPKVETADQLKTKFRNAMDSVSKLSDGFGAIADTFKIDLNFSGLSLFNKLNTLLSASSPRLDDFQYRYDLLKDLIDTYNEIKGLILNLNVECCPTIASFPKHLMLGYVVGSLELGEYAAFRHGFYHSPITTQDDENYERLMLLANRFVQKINGFQSYIGPVKITPSNLYVRLGEKAIPYYYNVDKPLLDKWNFEKAKTDRETYNLSYHTANLSSEDYVQNPLNYNIDNNDFYRIEGHLGLPFETAVQNINDLKVKYGLAFDVSVLLLNDGKKTDDEPEEPRKVSIEELRNKLLSISNDISKETGDPKNALLNLSKLDSDLKLLNKAKFETPSGSSDDVTIVKEDPKKEEISTELLSDFLERKSGLEHLSGVEPGGTFVLIAESKANNQVIADFSLSYLCCSKKDPVFLSLPSGKLCQNEKPVLMTIVPLDGQVKAFVNGTEISAITQTGGQSYFDPALVGAAYLGQTITFTVNDDPVDTQMVVYKKPEIVSVASGSITYSTPTTDPNTTDPDATVEFNVTGDFTDLDFTWNFGDGSQIHYNELPTNKKTHTYNLVSGQEETFHPTLTVTNKNGCSNVYELSPLKLKGQSTIACLSGMRIVVQFRYGPDGTHTCNRASFNLLGNGVLIEGTKPYSDPVIKGNIHLSNTKGNQDAGNIIPGGHPSSRYNEIIITQEEAEALAAGANEGFVQFSLDCAMPPTIGCHTGVAFTQLFLANDSTPIYSGYPDGNFLEINPCTGVTR